MKIWLQEFKNTVKNKNFILSFSVSIIFLIFSLIVNFYAGTYATERASSPVTDIVLSNIRVFDVDGIFIFGLISFWIFSLVFCVLRPRKMPFIVKSVALFVFIRSIFVTLTHIGPFPGGDIMTTSKVIEHLTFGGDLFFSGHTGMPFLMALIFWDNNKYLRYLFLFASLVFGVVVLLGHLHYSIDVLSAFFITYTIFHIARLFFKKDYENFLNTKKIESAII